MKWRIWNREIRYQYHLLILISYLFISDPSFHILWKYSWENRFAVLFMSDLNRSVEACVCGCLTAADPVRSYAAVPHNILRDAIGTFHTGKSASSSTGVTLHGNFLARIATQPAHLLRVITANYPVRRSTLRSFLKLSSACLINVAPNGCLLYTSPSPRDLP